jgi:oxidase EvaA
MNENGHLFLESALTAEGGVMSNTAVMAWFGERQQAHRFVIEPIPFSAMDKWGFAPDTGNLVHESGKFFSIEGIHVRTNFGGEKQWKQPVINQPEVGILGIIAKQFGGVLHFLMQVKMEPGNINMVQLSPTLQATRSNFTCVHQGKKPPYLEYFLNRGEHRTLVDALQSEQGGRFLKKRNRNIIIEVQGDVPVLPDYGWMTLGQIHKMMAQDNLVNMDSRTVIGCIPFGGGAGVSIKGNDPFKQKVLESVLAENGALHSVEELISWFTEQKVRYELDVERIPLNTVDEWEKTDSEIRHRKNDYFSVIACRVEAGSREVVSWTQPLVKTPEPGLVALIAKPINGLLHFLIQGKVEPGNFDIAEMAPTVQCTTGNYRRVLPAKRPPFLEYVLNARPEQVHFDVHLSEEGGRFYREANRNMIIEAGPDFPDEIPENYIWMTLHQIKELIRFNNYLNVEARCLVSCLSFIN